MIMNDATGKIYSAFFCTQDGTWSSMREVRDVLEGKGVYSRAFTATEAHTTGIRQRQGAEWTRRILRNLPGRWLNWVW